MMNYSSSDMAILWAEKQAQADDEAFEEAINNIESDD